MGIVRTGIVQRTVPGGGKKLYASRIMYSNIGHDELIGYMQKNANVGRATAVAAVDVFAKGLPPGCCTAMLSRFRSWGRSRSQLRLRLLPRWRMLRVM